MDPMVPYLTGWLSGHVMSRGGQAMKIVDVTPLAPDGFKVTFASGTELAVQVKEIPRTRGKDSDER